jgi:hypothetical protein
MKSPNVPSPHTSVKLVGGLPVGVQLVLMPYNSLAQDHRAEAHWPAPSLTSAAHSGHIVFVAPGSSGENGE